MPPNFDWKRFWCPRGESISLSDDGFLYVPEEKYGQYVNYSKAGYFRIGSTGPSGRKDRSITVDFDFICGAGQSIASKQVG